MGVKCLKCGNVKWSARLDTWKSCSNCGNTDKDQIIRFDKADLYVNRGSSMANRSYLS